MRRLPKGIPAAGKKPHKYVIIHTAKNSIKRAKGEKSTRTVRTEDGQPLQKGGVPAAPSGTATLLRLSPNHQFHPRPNLAETDFRRPRLSWLDGRCVQGPGTYSPRHG